MERMPAHEGRATAAGTQATVPASAGWARPFGATGLTASALGFGGYRVEPAFAAHAEALEAALRGGVNVIDTANNYGGGRSETLVGDVLDRLLRAEVLTREQLIVVTKVGYLQGETLSALGDVEPGPATVVLGPDHWHTMSPELIDRVAAVSAERLGLRTLDVLLLHNPEYLLEELGQEAFYQRVGDAFGGMERLTDAGRIAWYGVSSNGLACPPDAPNATSLERFVEAAERAGGPDHRMRVVQLPLNAIERGARSQGTLERAAQLGLAVLTNRPLNAVTPNGLLRLADPADVAAASDFKAARAGLIEVERTLDRSVPRWSRRIPIAMRDLGTAAEFDWWRTHRADHDLRSAEGTIPSAQRARLRAAYERLARAARAQLAYLDQQRLPEALADIESELGTAGTLSQRALAWVTRQPGVTTALCGMRTPAYVADALALAARGFAS